jgi:phosphoribosylformimino-5-aminoimidazole carboxamide ribotide isomerase
MIILPAIDIKDGRCVRLFQGDYSTAEVVAQNPIETAKSFERQGATWLHMVDLDGAKSGKPINAETVFQVRRNTGMHIEIGGGIRDMATLEYYIENGIDRVILGSAALQNPSFVEEAVCKYGKKVAVGIDALNGKVAVEGWLDKSEVDYIDLAKKMDKLGCAYLIVTDISKDGTMKGPNLEMLDKVNKAVNCNIIASGGVSNISDIENIFDSGLYGAIAGKAIYNKSLDLESAVKLGICFGNREMKNPIELQDNVERFFQKAELIPTIVQEDSTSEVLMLAYMNRESLMKSIETGYTWFYSRSRNALWNKGETSGHTQRIVNIAADCDNDTLLLKVEQKGPACHTGNHNCFYKEILKRE